MADQPSGPLAGVRVIDLSRLAPGPYASMLMGDLGADVTLVEAPAGAVEGASLATAAAPTTRSAGTSAPSS